MHYLYYWVVLIALCSCNGGKTARQEQAGTAVSENRREQVKYVNSLKWITPEKNRSFRFGEELRVEFENKDRFPIDSSAVYLNGRPVARLDAGTRTFTLPIPATRAGRQTLKIVAWHPDNRQGLLSTTIEVKPDKAPVRCSYRVVNTYPHDPRAYTQGLIFRDGYMYEGTGQCGESSIRKIDMKTGNILSVLTIDSQFFGEGITVFKDKIYQLTWRSRKGFVYDLKTFSPESSFSYNTEGWGITTVGDRLVMSDGSHKLYHVTPSSFHITKEVEVYDHNGPVEQLNELEYIDGLVWANVWLSDRIVAIDPETGVVKYDLDMTRLLSASERAKLDENDEVLNGIAWNPEKRTFYLTGKRWPKLFEVQVSLNP